MSRFDSYDDNDGESYPAHWWQNDLRRALTSKRGQRILRDIEAALLALPEHKLIADQIIDVVDWDENGDPVETPRFFGVCAVGAYAVHRKMVEGTPWNEAVLELGEEYPVEVDCFETQQLGQSLGLARTVAWQLAYLNDERFASCTPEERHAGVLYWVRGQIKPVEVTS